jgi:hypothetical protein
MLVFGQAWNCGTPLVGDLHVGEMVAPEKK